MTRAIAFPEPDPRGFWRAYLEWQSRASPAELGQLETSLETVRGDEPLPLSKAIRLCANGIAGAPIPPSLTARLFAPASQA